MKRHSRNREEIPDCVLALLRLRRIRGPLPESCAGFARAAFDPPARGGFGVRCNAKANEARPEPRRSRTRRNPPLAGGSKLAGAKRPKVSGRGPRMRRKPRSVPFATSGRPRHMIRTLETDD